MESRPPRKYDKTLLEFAQERLANLNEINASNFPELDHIAPSLLWQFIPVPKEQRQPEYVHIPFGPIRKYYSEEQTAVLLAIAEWNSLWEAGYLRYDFFKDRLPLQLKWLKKFEESNLYLLPDAGINKYDIYSTLYHLLPRATLERFNLPVLKKGIWPVWTYQHILEPLIKSDFERNLSKAFAYHIWPLLNPRAKLKAFSPNDPLVILSHNLNYWLPFAIRVVEERIKTFDRVPCENAKQSKKLDKLRKKIADHFSAERPLYGGSIWYGEEEAMEATSSVVEVADKEGKLRAIMDSIRSSRVEDDFSPIWSYEREDFERKLYKKRSKIKVRFVELEETIPIHGPHSELHEDLLWEDFFAVLNQKEKAVTVCLRNGHTKVGEISKMLGYANHSPISKLLKKVRVKAEKYFNLN